ncbi:MAG TPA: (2Fe-2S)-binding protein [Thermoanaerobaculia bacterium]|nr:(2Fe-2S)-binding protein [Thermoanaerobaculia bacterium]
MIVCICRGTSDRKIVQAIDNGATSLRDLQRCGIGDQCGSCHNSLRAMLASAQAAQPCPACTGAPEVAVPAMALA